MFLLYQHKSIFLHNSGGNIGLNNIFRTFLEMKWSLFNYPHIQEGIFSFDISIWYHQFYISGLAFQEQTHYSYIICV